MPENHTRRSREEYEKLRARFITVRKREMLARRGKKAARRVKREEARAQQSTEQHIQKTHSLNNNDQKQGETSLHWRGNPKTIQSNKRTWTRLTGIKLVKFCEESIAENIPETSICTRSGYEIKNIGQFRRAFSAAAEVRLGPLSRMATDLKQSQNTERTVETEIYSDRGQKQSLVKSNSRSNKFRMEVLNTHGQYCACCDINLPDLLEAAHIVPVADNGSDSANNGLPLCPTHHSAFDRHLFSISPKTGQLIMADGFTTKQLMITKDFIRLNISSKALQVRMQQFHGFHQTE